MAISSFRTPSLPDGQSERFYLERFMDKFGAKWNEEALHTAQTNQSLLISREMFVNHNTGASKIHKKGRAPYALYLADTIIDPEEIRLFDSANQAQWLYFLARYQVGKDQIGMLAVFKRTSKVWTGWTGYPSDNESYFESKRGGLLLYQRQEYGG